VSEDASLDAIFEPMARDELDDVDRDAGQHILDALASQQRRSQGLEEDPLHELLRQAHQSTVDDDKG
jgi:hypothetical protein